MCTLGKFPHRHGCPKQLAYAVEFSGADTNLASLRYVSCIVSNSMWHFQWIETNRYVRGAEPSSGLNAHGTRAYQWRSFSTNYRCWLQCPILTIKEKTRRIHIVPPKEHADVNATNMGRNQTNENMCHSTPHLECKFNQDWFKFGIATSKGGSNCTSSTKSATAVFVITSHTAGGHQHNSAFTTNTILRLASTRS